MTTKLYVGNLSFDTDQQELQTLFGEAGTVTDVAVLQDNDTGRSRGFGFVTMSSTEEAQKAISLFNGREVGGRALNVNEARPREDRQSGGGAPRGGNRGGNRGGGGGGGRGRY